jgi:ABC-2 type transport system permease protein
MTHFRAAFWAELLKARRSLIVPLTALGMGMLPLVGGLFMIILKDPDAARKMGLISEKANILAGTADWPAFFGILLQGAATAGAVIFALLTSWIFGREFSDRTNTQLLALPAPRVVIVTAKLVLLGLWTIALSLLIYLVALGVGFLVVIPGWSMALAVASFRSLLGITLLTYMLMPVVALLASAGRGYLPAMGWAFFTVVIAQIAAVLGRGDWVPWSVPALLSGAAGPRASALGLHSYLIVMLAFAVGALATLRWWQQADQPR